VPIEEEEELKKMHRETLKKRWKQNFTLETSAEI